jgi:hypothetical protein
MGPSCSPRASLATPNCRRFLALPGDAIGPTRNGGSRAERVTALSDHLRAHFRHLGANGATASVVDASAFAAFHLRTGTLTPFRLGARSLPSTAVAATRRQRSASPAVGFTHFGLSRRRSRHVFGDDARRAHRLHFERHALGRLTDQLARRHRTLMNDDDAALRGLRDRDVPFHLDGGGDHRDGRRCGHLGEIGRSGAPLATSRVASPSDTPQTVTFPTFASGFSKSALSRATRSSSGVVSLRGAAGPALAIVGGSDDDDGDGTALAIGSGVTEASTATADASRLHAARRITETSTRRIAASVCEHRDQMA